MKRVSLLSVLLSLGRAVRGNADLVLLPVGGPDKSAFFFCATPAFSRRFAIFRTQSCLVRPRLLSKVRFSCFPLQSVFSMAASEQVLEPTKVSCPSPLFARGFGLCHVGMLGIPAFAVHASFLCRASRRCELMEAWRARVVLWQEMMRGGIVEHRYAFPRFMFRFLTKIIGRGRYLSARSVGVPSSTASASAPSNSMIRRSWQIAYPNQAIVPH
jgi:hypothetical protein